MRISKRTLIITIVTGVILLCGCVAVFLLFSQAQPASAPPAGEEPPEPEATAPLPSVLPTSEPAVTAIPAINESRRITIEYPPQLRAGDSDLVRLTLEVDDLGNVTPTAQLDGNVITGEVVEIPNLYETHHVIAEAQFDIAGLEIRPTGLSSQPLDEGQSVTFYWSIRPEEVGFYRGTVWLHLRFVDKQNGEESRKAVSAQIVEIEAVNLLGLSANFVRATGVIGSVVGTVLGFPFFEDIVKWFLRRRIRRAA